MLNIPPYQRIPNEIWLEILGQLPQGDHANVKLSSRMLLPVSRTLQFQIFKFYPYDIDYRTLQPQRVAQSDEDIIAALGRLEFWASEEIAHFVRRISLEPWCRPELGSTLASSDSANYDTVVNTFFQKISLFVNLQTLDCFRIAFPQSSLQQLSQLSVLKELLIERCDISMADPPSSLLRLKCLKFQHPTGTHEQLEAEGAHRWLRFIDLPKLQSLKLLSPRGTTVFFYDLATVGVMSSLRALDISFGNAIPTLLIPILMMAPALEILKATFWGTPEPGHWTRMNALPSSPVPLLVEYCGPYELLRLIQPGKHLHRLTLSGLDGGKAPPLLESLHPFRDAMKHVESLGLSLCDFSEPTFTAICSVFANVKSLWLRVSYNDGSDLYAVRFTARWMVQDTLTYETDTLGFQHP